MAAFQNMFMKVLGSHIHVKKKKLLIVAHIYIEKKKIKERDMRFDIVSVNLNTHETRIIKNAFEVDY